MRPCRAASISCAGPSGSMRSRPCRRPSIDAEARAGRPTDHLLPRLRRVDLVRLAGLPGRGDGHPTAHGRGADLCPALCAVHAGRHCRRGRPRCAGHRSRSSRQGLAHSSSDQGLEWRGNAERPDQPATFPQTRNGETAGIRHARPAVLAPEQSEALRDPVADGELAPLTSADTASTWAQRRAPGQEQPNAPTMPRRVGAGLRGRSSGSLQRPNLKRH